MKRMVFGLNMEAVGLPEGASLTIQLDSDNRNPIILTSEASTFESIYSFYTEYGVKACTGDPYIGVYENEGEEPVDYYTNLSLSIILKRADQRLVNLGSHLIKVQRKKITNVTINVGNSANLTSNGLTIDTEEGGDLENGNSYDYDVDEGEFEDKTLNPQS